MNYSDKNLQDHELDFWVNHYNPPFYHMDYYKSFFDFEKLSEKKVIDIGCGGAPISEYIEIPNINLTILDPLINDLLKFEKFSNLKKYNYFSGSLFDFDKSDYDYIVCLNVIDHFNDDEYTFIDKFFDFLNKNGELWLYYDLRHKNDGDHLLIDNEKLMNKLNTKFSIIDTSDKVNPKHINWSTVYSSIRLIAKKK
jgi:2-polyprenyl-3-methyl-5-hydroxy-6-metoxy-1,4-benzoquinol methylase